MIDESSFSYLAVNRTYLVSAGEAHGLGIFGPRSSDDINLGALHIELECRVSAMPPSRAWQNGSDFIPEPLGKCQPRVRLSSRRGASTGRGGCRMGS